jgi:hypothetical protein
MNAVVDRAGPLLLLLVLMLPACEGGSGPSDGATATEAVPAVGTSATGTPPTPLAAWSLHGDGHANVGGVDLEFDGGYTLTKRGAAFDGLTGSAVTEGAGPLDTTQSLTLSAWVSYTDRFVDVPMVVGQAGEQNLSIGFGIAGSDWIFGTSDYDLPGADGGGALISGPAAVRSDDWVHLVGVSDREAGVISFYVDGALIDETTASEPFAAGGPLIVGGQDRDQVPSGAPEPGGWAGAIRDVVAYQTALTADQITEIYETTKPDGPPPRWRPDPATYADGVLDGTWDVVMDRKLAQLKDDLESDYGKSIGEARIRLGFDGPRFWQGFVIDGDLWLVDGYPEGDGGIARIDGDQVTIASGDGTTTYRWHLAGDQLHLGFVKECDGQGGGCRTRADVADTDPTVLLVMEHDFTKSGDDPSF